VSGFPSKHLKIRGRDYGVWIITPYPFSP